MFDTNLPQPNDSFDWVQVDGRPALVCRALEPFAWHLWTTRSWQLGDRTTDPEAAWHEVAAAAGRGLIRVHQVHGADVLVHRTGNPPPSGTADIIVGNDRSAALAIQTADCVPVLIVDRRTGAVAAAHAGWRGLAAGVPRIAVEALAREFGSRPADLLAAAGPSIGACCYQVGEDVRERFLQGGWRTRGSWFFETPQPTSRNPSMSGVGEAMRTGHWYFDSAAAARDQLEAAGMLREQIFLAGLCTASHSGAFCSYRRDGAPAGRMAATIRFAPPHRP
jgi:purine-nucleoside/S-methyl-5'-thioadenosine phosphorylase / adenosine deaminase